MDDLKQATATLIFAGLLCIIALVAILRRPAPIEQFAAAQPVIFRINPNTADAHTLCLLPQIGPRTAEKLIDDRQANGPFNASTDLQRVPGIGIKTCIAIEPWIELSVQAPPR